MIALPDYATLALCSAMSSMAFALVFAIIWIGRRDRYLLHWAGGAAAYAVSLIGLGIAPPGPTVLRALLVLLVPISDLLILTGARAFHHRRPFRPWMIVPLTFTLVAWLIQKHTASLDLPVHLHLLGQQAVMIALAGTIIVSGGPLLVRRPWRLLGGGRLAGAALLAYLPAYAAAIAIEHIRAVQGPLDALLPLLADQLVLPILNLGLLWMPSERASQELREGALRDPLTGAWNRRWLDRHRADLSEVGSAVILIDIDHFKSINDRHGHAAGDKVLRGFTDRARGLLDPRDGFIVRLGGDEFLAILPEADGATARLVAEQLRACLHPGSAEAPVATASIGVAFVGRDASLSEAMADADRALYRAKAAGRDRIAV